MSSTVKDRMRVLVVDDEAMVRESLSDWFEEDGHAVAAAADANDALALLRKDRWDLAFVDVKMPGMDGLELQRRIHDVSSDTTVIVMTAHASVETAVQALKEGAYDYITKPFDLEYLNHLVRKTTERRRLVRENITLKRQLADVVRPDPILGQSAAIRRVIELVETVAPTETTILISGAFGTGKELVARAIHAESPRAYMPLVVANCGAMPEGTLESELLGHARGARAGARHRQKGKFELANGGTLYLDEIAEISPKIQVELLRVMEEKKVTRLGGSRSVPADFRTVAASSKNLRDEMQAGRFREDLYYRLNVFHIAVPPLRERRQDIPILARAFTERLARAMNCSTPELRPEALDALVAYDWPGNVRELTNAIERAMVIRKGSEIRYEDLPITPVTTPRATAPVDTHSLALAAVEKTHVARVLRACGWNISKTARVLKVDRATVYNKIRQYGLSRDQP